MYCNVNLHVHLTLQLCGANKVPAALVLKGGRNGSVVGEVVEQSSVLPLREQAAAHRRPQRAQLEAVGGIKVLQSHVGGRVPGQGGGLLRGIGQFQSCSQKMSSQLVYQ